MSIKNKLTGKQERFCQEYIIDFNATRAAMTAGYSKKSSKTIANQNLSKLYIQERISELTKNLEKRTEITQEMVIKELALIAFSDIQDYIKIDPDTGAIVAKSFDEMRKDVSRAIASISEDQKIAENNSGTSTILYSKTKFKNWDKLKALELLSKYIGIDGARDNPIINITIEDFQKSIKSVEDDD